MVLVESRRLVKLSAWLSRRGVQGVDTGVERRLLLDITQEASEGPDNRLRKKNLIRLECLAVDAACQTVHLLFCCLYFKPKIEEKALDWRNLASQMQV